MIQINLKYVVSRTFFIVCTLWNIFMLYLIIFQITIELLLK